MASTTATINLLAGASGDLQLDITGGDETVTAAGAPYVWNPTDLIFTPIGVGTVTTIAADNMLQLTDTNGQTIVVPLHGLNSLTIVASGGSATTTLDTGTSTSCVTLHAANGANLNFGSIRQQFGAFILTPRLTRASFATSSGNTLLLGGLTVTLSGSNPAAVLNLAGNKLIVESTISTKLTVLSALQVAVSYGNGHVFGIRDVGHPADMGVAVADNGILGRLSFGGMPVDSNSILISQELLGDTNIDGHVDLTDLSTILNNFGTTTAAWTSGNCDGAPTIDLTDLSDVLNDFGLTNPNANVNVQPPGSETGSGGGSDSGDGANQTYTPSSDHITLKLCSANNTLEVSDGTTTVYVPLADLSSFIVLSGENNEIVTVDQSSGDLPTGVEIDGDGNTTLVISSGSYTFNTDAGDNASNLTVEASNRASLIFNATQNIAALILDSGTSATITSGNVGVTVGSLSIAGNVNVSNGSLVSNSTIIAAGGSFLQSGGSASLGVIDDAGAITISNGDLTDDSYWGTILESTGSLNQSGGNVTLTDLDDYGAVSLTGSANFLDSSGYSWIEQGATFAETSGYASLYGVTILGEMDIAGGSMLSYNSNISNTGAVNQSGGDVQIAHLSLVNGTSAGGPTYTLSNGTLTTLTTTATAWGVFDQLGGTSQVIQKLWLKTNSSYNPLGGSSQVELLQITSARYDQEAGDLSAVTISSNGIITINNGSVIHGISKSLWKWHHHPEFRFVYHRQH